jgi:hypothetical protein
MMPSPISAQWRHISKFSVEQRVEIMKLPIHYRNAGTWFRASSTIKQNSQYYKFIKLTDETVDICNLRFSYGEHKEKSLLLPKAIKFLCFKHNTGIVSWFYVKCVNDQQLALSVTEWILAQKSYLQSSVLLYRPPSITSNNFVFCFHRLCSCVPFGSHNEQNYFPNVINRCDFVTEAQYVYYGVRNEFLYII